MSGYDEWDHVHDEVGGYDEEEEALQSTPAEDRQMVAIVAICLALFGLVLVWLEYPFVGLMMQGLGLAFAVLSRRRKRVRK